MGVISRPTDCFAPKCFYSAKRVQVALAGAGAEPRTGAGAAAQESRRSGLGNGRSSHAPRDAAGVAHDQRAQVFHACDVGRQLLTGGRMDEPLEEQLEALDADLHRMAVHRGQRHAGQAGSEQVVAGADTVVLRNPLAAGGQLVHHAVGGVVGDADERRDAFVFQTFRGDFPRLLARLDEGAGAQRVRRAARIHQQLRARAGGKARLRAHQPLADADALPLTADFHEGHGAVSEAQQVVGDQLAHAQVVDDDGVQRGAVALVVDDHGGDGLRHADCRLRVHRRRRENHAGDADARKRVHQAQLALRVAVGFQHDGVVAVPVRLLGDGLRDAFDPKLRQ